MISFSFSDAVEVLSDFGVVPVYENIICRGYIYININVTNLLADKRPFLYVGSRGLGEKTSKINPKKDLNVVYPGSGGLKYQRDYAKCQFVGFVIEHVEEQIERTELYVREQFWLDHFGALNDERFYNVSHNLDDGWRAEDHANPKFRKAYLDGFEKFVGHKINRSNHKNAKKFVWDILDKDPTTPTWLILKLSEDAGITYETAKSHIGKWRAHQRKIESKNSEELYKCLNSKENIKRTTEMFDRYKPDTDVKALLIMSTYTTKVTILSARKALRRWRERNGIVVKRGRPPAKVK